MIAYHEVAKYCNGETGWHDDTWLAVFRHFMHYFLHIYICTRSWCRQSHCWTLDSHVLKLQHMLVLSRKWRTNLSDSIAQDRFPWKPKTPSASKWFLFCSGGDEQDKLFLFRAVHETDNRCLGAKQDIDFLSDKKSYICWTNVFNVKWTKIVLHSQDIFFLASALLVIARFSFFFDIEIKKR